MRLLRQLLKMRIRRHLKGDAEVVAAVEAAVVVVHAAAPLEMARTKKASR